ncbi:MAG: hypothetical protein KKE12_20205, partial [Proteobacteria bacterium]|nr:hypothetical protein [Pseudomonadota bacterium]
MKKNILPFSLNCNDPSPIAIFNNENITYANTAFEKLYKPLKKEDKKKVRQLLSRLSSELIRSDKKVIQKQIELIPNHKKIKIIVYLLNKSGSEENSLLLVADQEESVGDFPYFNPGRAVDLDNSPKVELSSAFSRLIGEDFK